MKNRDSQVRRMRIAAPTGSRRRASARCAALPPLPSPAPPSPRVSRRAPLVRPVVARTTRAPSPFPPRAPLVRPHRRSTARGGSPPAPPPKTMHPANGTSPDAMQGRSYARDNSDGHLDCPSSVFISLPSWQLSCPLSWRASDSRISDKRHPRVQCRTKDNDPASCRA